MADSSKSDSGGVGAAVNGACNQAPRHPAPGRYEARTAGLWIGLFGGFLGLTIQTLANFAVSSIACFTGRIARHAAPASIAWWVLLWTTVLSVILCVGSIAVAYTCWKPVRSEADLSLIDGQKHELLEIGEGRTRFMAMAGMITSAILLATMLFHGMAVLTSSFCRFIE